MRRSWSTGRRLGAASGKPSEQVIKAALYDVLQDVAEVERIFLIIKAQKEY